MTDGLRWTRTGLHCRCYVGVAKIAIYAVLWKEKKRTNYSKVSGHERYLGLEKKNHFQAIYESVEKVHFNKFIIGDKTHVKHTY